MLKEFQEFINRGSVLDLAVGIIIGTAFKDIIKALVNEIAEAKDQSIGQLDALYATFKANAEKAGVTRRVIIPSGKAANFAALRTSSCSSTSSSSE